MFVNTTGSVLLLPTVTCPNDRLDGTALSALLRMPLAWMPSERVEFEALLVMVMVVSIHPDVDGENITLKLTLCPAGITQGSFRPGMLKPDARVVIAEIVTLDCPVFVRIVLCASDCPTATDPNLRYSGELTNCAERAHSADIAEKTKAAV